MRNKLLYNQYNFLISESDIDTRWYVERDIYEAPVVI